MKYELKIIDECICKDLYNMYQDIPQNSVGYENRMYGLTYSEYLNLMKNDSENQTDLYKKIVDNTSIYIFFVNDYPVGEIGIRTIKNDFWLEKGSQIFYVIRSSERNKVYGTEMLKYALTECKKLGFNKIGINCDDNNIGSKKVILKNGGLLKFSYIRADGGHSSRYIINIGD